MELSDLVTFSTVARLGGITRAADELNTVQSNVTQRVKALEAEIGTALFERHSRGMTLTGAGRRLLPYAQRMAALSREAVLAARGHTGIRPHRAGVPPRLHLPAAARAGIFGVRLAVRGAVRTGHARRHDRLRRRRHGRDAAAPRCRREK